MIKKIDYLLWAIGYLVKTKILRNEIPFIGGLVINEKCNLQCTHCKVSNRDMPDLSFKDVEIGLKAFYEKGIRSVFIEGGEPFLWRDGMCCLDDVINLARQIGFKVVSVYTNGTLPIHAKADTIFVSLDGLRKTNNMLRGDIYDRVIKNICESYHDNIVINFTINKKNEYEIEEFCDEIARLSKVSGIFFYFHTPYYGVDDLFLDMSSKRKIISRILILKKKGYRIFNSTACLKSIYNNAWMRPSKICYVYADNKMYQCCRAIGNKEACSNCGYLGYPEIIHILSLKPSAIIESLQYLPRG